MSRRTQRSPLWLLWAAVVIWASTFIFSKQALQEMGPGTLTTLRFTAATLILLPFAVARGLKLHDILHRRYAACGLTGIALYFGLQNLGLVSTSAGSAALLQAALPPATALFAWIWLRERFGPRRFMGLVLAVTGVTLSVGDSGAGLGHVGDFLILGGICAYALFTVQVRRLGLVEDPVVLAEATSAWGLAFVSPWCLWEVTTRGLGSISGIAMAEVLYLGVVASGLALLLWNAALQHVPASVAGIFTGGIPAFGYAFALLAGEPPALPRLVGGVLALTGIIVAEGLPAAPTAVNRSDRVPASVITRGNRD